MKDYIDILLEDLASRQIQTLPGEGRIQEVKADEAAGALLAELTPEQRKLFGSYERERSHAFFLEERHLARQAFLLAKEVYR